jgi:tetrahedral aminopeptidase
MFDLVKTLTELPGPTGYEGPVQDWLAQEWRHRGLHVERAPVGNLLARLGGQGAKLLIGAHADEISFRVKSVDEQGYVWLTAGRGGAEQRPPEPVPLGHVAHVITDAGTATGTFVTAIGHVLTRQQRAHYQTHGLDWMDFYVDIGARSRADAERLGVLPGCPVLNIVPTRRDGQNIVGKAMDDRAGLAVMTTLVDRIDRARLQYEVWFASTVMEEVGLIGARSAIAGFDLGIVVEVGLAGDIPLVDRREMPVALGEGPIIAHKDMGVHYTKDLISSLTKCARAASIPLQHAVFPNFASDGREWLQQGVPTAMIAFPCRYTHSPFETIQESDLDLTVDLLAAFLTTAPS